ncbi:MAG: hypothetical protein KY452_12280 [Actinobacteria bacterium]|nr:hypothetical protein [Actinomycetota bacterium]
MADAGPRAAAPGALDVTDVARYPLPGTNAATGAAFSPDGRWLVFRGGADGQEQLHRVAVDALTGGAELPEAVTLTAGLAGVDDWEWAPDSERIYFVRPDTFDAAEKERKEKARKARSRRLRRSSSPRSP